MNTEVTNNLTYDCNNSILTEVVPLNEITNVAKKLWGILNQRAVEKGLDTALIDAWYRGQAKKSYKLLPSLFRFPHGFSVEIKLFSEYKLERPSPNDWVTLFEMQHYFLPTRLLDWTTNIDIAIYFAANSDDTDSPCIFILHPYLLNHYARMNTNLSHNICHDEEPCCIELHQPPFRYREDWLKKCVDDNALPLAIKPPKIFNDTELNRIRAQSSCFTLHGTSKSPLEEQCPEALAKIEIRDFKRKDADDYLMLTPHDVFPDIIGISMYFRDRFKLNPDPEKRITVTLEEMWRNDHERLKQGQYTSFLIPGISGCIINEMYIERGYESNKFKAWLNDKEKSFAIVTGPAASGKTNFLINAIIQNCYYSHHPVLFYSLGRYNPRRYNLMSDIAEFLTKMPNHGIEIINANILRDMIADGRIILVLDGLDELARNHGEKSVDHLDTELNRLVGSKTPKIVIACRDHIYDRLQGPKKLIKSSICQKISLSPLDTTAIYDKIKLKLSEVGMTDISFQASSVAFSIMAEIPLFYSAVINNLDSVAVKLSTVSKKSQFWDMWISLSTMQNKENSDIQKVLHELGSIAVEMLSKRSDYLSDKELGNQLSKVEKYAYSSCPVFTKEANNKWRFIHQAIREYTLASCMKIGLENPLNEESVISQTPSFDYESVETYLYLMDMLPDKSLEFIIKNIGNDFEAIRDNKKWNNFARNYFEAVGMIGTKGKVTHNTAISQALNVLKDPLNSPGFRANFLTKFNAARCLCRLHPSSPEIYCKQVVSYNWQKNPKNYILAFGYAIRGFHRHNPEPGNYPPEVFIKPDIYDDRQSEVTEELLNVFDELVNFEELHLNGEHLKINTSHALIRWLDLKGAHRKQNLERIKGFLYCNKLCNMSKANLIIALYLGGIKEMELILEKSSKYPNGIFVNLDNPDNFLSNLKKITPIC